MFWVPATIRQQFVDEQISNDGEHSVNLKEMRVNEHTGTQIVAPLQFTDDGTSIRRRAARPKSPAKPLR